MNELQEYLNLINLRQKEPYSGRGENHHIIPRSLNNRENVLKLFSDYKKTDIVHLSYEEHFRAHCLLLSISEKLLDTKAVQKMSNAWERMAYDKKHQTMLSEEEYAHYRELFIKNCRLGENNPAKREDVKKKISISQKGKKKPREKGLYFWFTNGIEDTRAKQCPEGYYLGRSKIKNKTAWNKGLTGKYTHTVSREAREKISQALKGKEVSKETRDKISQNSLRCWQNAEYREKLSGTNSVRFGKPAWNRGKKYTEDLKGKNWGASRKIVRLDTNLNLEKIYNYMGELEDIYLISNVSRCIHHKYGKNSKEKNLYKNKIFMSYEEYKLKENE